MMALAVIGVAVFGFVRADEAHTTPPIPLYASAVLGDSPVAYWRLNEAAGALTAADSSGNGRSGTFYGTPAMEVDNSAMADGDYGVSIVATGGQDYVGITSSTALSPSSAVTLEAWVKLTNVSSNQFFIAKNNAYGLGLNSAGKLVFQLFGAQSYASAHGLTANAWTHVAASFNGSGATFYINGVQKDTIAGARAVPTSTSAVLLGKAGIPFQIWPMAGSLDEVAIYASALNSSQISAHYAAASQVDPPTNLKAPKISGEAAVGDTLTISSGSWTYRPAISRQWRRCDSTGASCVDISAETSATYVVALADIGHTIRAVVTATTTAGATNATAGATRVATVNRIRDQAAYDLAVLPDAPYAYWPLDETSGTKVNDRSGNNHPLSVGVRGSGGSPVWGYPSPAVDAAALHTRGNPNTSTAGDQVAGSLGGSASQFMDNFSAELWVKTAVTGGFLIGYGQPYRSGTVNGWALMLNNGQLTVAIGGAIVGWGASLPSNVWAHVAVTRTSGTWRTYLNGRLVKSFTQTAATPPGTRFWLANDDWGGGGPGLVGEIANGAVYTSVLSAARIRAHYDALAPAVVPARQARGVPGEGQGLAVNPTGYHADPVNTATGSFFTEATDLGLPGIGVPFTFKRTYNSSDSRVGRLGRGWSDNLDWSVTIEADGGAVVRAGDGQELHFTLLADGSFSADGGGRATLSGNSTSGYTLTTTEDQIQYAFNGSGRLSSVQDKNGEGLTLAYNSSGLSSVTDSSGRTITVTITSGRITAIALPSGAGSVAFAYTSGLLTSVTDVLSGVLHYSYDSGSRLATIIDQNNVTVLTNTYNATTGRVTDQADSRGKHSTFAWNATTQVATVTDPNGEIWKDYYLDNVLLKQEPPTGDATVYARDGNLNLVAVAGPGGEQTAMSHDASGNLLSLTAPPSLDNVTKTFTYDSQNNVQSVTDGLGNVTTYTYDSAGNNTQVAVNAVPVSSSTYDSDGQRLTSTDGRGNTTTYTYDANGNLTSVTDPLGNTTTHTYDAAGRILTTVDPLGNVSGGTPADFTTTYTYDAAGRVLTTTDQLGAVTTNTYDAVGNLTTTTDARGNTTTTTYDGDGRVLTITGPDPDGSGSQSAPVTTYTYDDAGNKLTETDPLAHTTSYQYDINNRLISTTSPLGNISSSSYDEDGNQVAVVDPRGNASGATPGDYTTTSTYDAAGRLLAETNPLGETTSRTYDAVGNVLTVTDPRGKVTTNTYDDRNRLASVTAPDGGITTYTYDGNGNELTRTDPRGKVWTSTYDLANRLTSSTTPLGNETTYFYDANGRQTEVVEPRGNVSGADPDDYASLSTYDRVGRLLTSTDPLGNETAYTYDAVGNKLSITDALNRTTSYVYDAANQLITVVAPDLTETSYGYDLAGNLTSRTDANSHTTTYSYDADGRKTETTSPLGQTWTSTYDPAGAILETVDANGNGTSTAGDGTTTNSYDRAGRLTAIDYSDSTPDVTFAYDAGGNRISMTDGAGTETRDYDDASRLVEVTRGSETFNYVYDLAGNLVQRTYPDSTVTEYEFDDDGRMATAESGGNTTSYAYDPAGHLEETVLPSSNGTVETVTYDRAGRVVNLENAQGSTVLSAFSTTYDAVGNPLEVVRTGSLAGTTTYDYDQLNRLTGVCYQSACPGGSDPFIRWTYDAVGNRLTEARPVGITAYSYNAADQLTHVDSTSYAYDANGNQVSRGADSFSYDLANRLSSAAVGSTTTEYTYDGDGKRLEASTGSAVSDTTLYSWDDNNALPQLASEHDGASALLRRYVYGDRRISMTAAGNDHYYAYDSLGSATDLTDASGDPEWAYDYEPFGTARTETQLDPGAPTNPMRFTGELLDPTDFYHLRARQYDSEIARFHRTDPVEQSAQRPYISSYTYAGNQPTVMADPSGETQRPAREGQASAQAASAPSAGVNRSRIVWYLRRWALDTNPAFGRARGGLVSGENDCTNFVSQALYYGGWKQDATWNATKETRCWGLLGAFECWQAPKLSVAWVRVSAFIQYAIGSRATLSSSFSRAMPGDIVAADWSGGSSWHHLMGITSVTGRNIKIASHGNDRVDFDLFTNGAAYSGDSIQKRQPRARFALLHLR